MDSIAPLAQRMPYTAAFPKALGTGLLISTPHPITAELRGEMERFIDEYEHALSRFRADSLVAHIGNAEHGGHFDFPDWAGPLFDLYDALHAATRGAIDPCVGEDLIRLGYDPALSFTVEADAGERLGALHGRAVWGRDVVRSSGTTLVTRSPVHVDFGACGKGYLVDSLGGLLTDSELSRTSHVKSAETTNPTCQSSTSDSKRESAAPEFVIDAGGDLLARTNKPIRVALEDPDDPSCAVGVALIGDGAFCASAPSRRHWEVAVNEQTHLAIHHLLNAIDGLPAQQTEATWVAVRTNPSSPCSQPRISGWNFRHFNPATGMNSENTTSDSAPTLAGFPTAMADGLATSLFVADSNELSHVFTFDCAVLDADRHATVSTNFPGHFFQSAAPTT
jgi:thiamine biosynthesis lipoprotein